MNIPQIMGYNFPAPAVRQKQQLQTSEFGLKMSSPLAHDTVNFKSTAKGANRAYGATKDLAVAVAAYADGRQSEIVRFAKKHFSDLFRMEGIPEPKNSMGQIKARSKSWTSILDKSGSGKWASYEEIIDNMTDLNGMKFVMDDASKSNVHAMLNRWGQLVKKGFVEVDEIEIKRPKAVEKLKDTDAEKYKYDYATEPSLKRLARIQFDKTGKNILDKDGNIPVDYTKGNYTALHMLARFPGAKHGFEVQIVGTDVDTYKKLNDLFWKVLNGKNVDKKYGAKFKKRLAPLMGESEESVKMADKFWKYSGDVFLFQRLKEPTGQHSKKVNFPPPIYDLPENLHMNSLWNLMVECDNASVKAKKK